MNVQAVKMADPNDMTGLTAIASTVALAVWGAFKAWTKVSSGRVETANNSAHVSMLNELQDENKRLRGMVDSKDQEIRQLSLENHEFRADIKVLMGKIEVLTTEVTSLRKQVENMAGSANAHS